MAESMPGHYRASVIADLLSISTATLRRYALDGIVPKQKKGLYELRGVVSGYVRHLDEKAKRGPEDVFKDSVPGPNIAEMFGITYRRFRQLVNEGVLPEAESRGKYNLTKSVRAYLKHAGDPIDSGLSKTAVDLDYKRTKTDRERLKLQVERGEHIPLAVHETEISEGFKDIAAELDTAPDALELELNLDKEQVKLLRIIVDRLRDRMADRVIGGAESRVNENSAA